MEAHIGKLNVKRRTGLGKLASRKLRQQGLIPAVIYGKGGASEPLALDPENLKAALDPQRKRNTLIEMTIEAADGSSEKVNVMVHDHQIDPLGRNIVHADFIRVALDEPVQAEVPLESTGRAKGVQMGGLLNQVFRTVSVECTPDRIPAKIVVDVTELDIGGHIRVADLPLPEGVRATLPAEQTLLLIVAARGAAEAGATEGGAPTEGAAGGAAASS